MNIAIANFRHNTKTQSENPHCCRCHVGDCDGHAEDHEVFAHQLFTSIALLYARKVSRLIAPVRTIRGTEPVTSTMVDACPI